MASYLYSKSLNNSFWRMYLIPIDVPLGLGRGHEGGSTLGVFSEWQGWSIEHLWIFLWNRFSWVFLCGGHEDGDGYVILDLDESHANIYITRLLLERVSWTRNNPLISLVGWVSQTTKEIDWHEFMDFYTTIALAPSWQSRPRKGVKAHNRDFPFTLLISPFLTFKWGNERFI